MTSQVKRQFYAIQKPDKASLTIPTTDKYYYASLLLKYYYN